MKPPSELYHVTPITNIESIKEKGLLPHDPKIWGQPKGVYLTQYLPQWIEYMVREKRLEYYAIITVDVKGLELYDDVGLVRENSYKAHRGFYVKCRIPLSRILKITTHNC